MPRKKRIDEIKRLCDEAGLSYSEVFREAKRPYSTIANWTRKEPDNFETYDALIDTIEKLKKAKEAETEKENAN